MLTAVCAGACWSLVITSVAQANLTVVEGQSFSGKVVDIGTCALTHADIYWGDGTATSPGVTDGHTGVKGTHTYADERTANGNVSYTCSGGVGTQTAYFTTTVKDAPLTASKRDASGQVGQPLTAVVAHFTDGNPSAGVSDFSGRIDWGDGLSSNGTVAAAAGGGFNVTGTHTYERSGAFALRTVITDVGGSSAAASSSAQIGAPRPVAAFRFTPTSPCSGTQITFDASGSTGDIVKYEWRWYFGPPHGAAHHRTFLVIGSAPSLVKSFPRGNDHKGEFLRADVTPPAIQQSDGVYILYNVYAFHSRALPQHIGLVVTDRAGRQASVEHAVRFENAGDEVEEIGIPQDSNGDDDFDAPGYTWQDFGPSPANAVCHSHTTPPGFGLTLLKGSPVAVHANRSLVAKLPCPGPDDCFGMLVVQRPARRFRATPARVRRHPRPRPDPRTLASAEFSVRGGHVATVRLKFNRKDRALARAHKLRNVQLILRSLRAHGKVVTTRRVVHVRFRRR